jgi:hypothetical protein
MNSIENEKGEVTSRSLRPDVFEKSGRPYG